MVMIESVLSAEENFSPREESRFAQKNAELKENIGKIQNLTTEGTIKNLTN